MFHSDWQAKALATTLACGALGAWNIDAGRHAREALVPRDYARFSDYEKWVSALADLLVTRGVLTVEDLVRARQLALGETQLAAPARLCDTALRAADVLASQRKVVPYTRAGGPAALFRGGDRVRTASYNPNQRKPGGHTRLPAYAMGRIGTVKLYHDSHVLPDSNAPFLGESPEPLYAVEFTAQTLWDGDAEDTGDCMVLDLWQSYLETADP